MMMIVRLSNMAGKKIVKGSEEWQMFQDFWKLAQEIWEPEDTDEYWQEVIGKTDEFIEEMADTVIMIWQIKYLLGVGEGEKIQKIMREKNIGEVKRKRRNRKYLKRHTALSYIRKRMKKKVNSGR